LDDTPVKKCLLIGNATHWGGYTLQLASKRHIYIYN